MRFFLLFISVVFLAGCVTTSYNTTQSSQVTISNEDYLIDTSQVAMGMTPQEVQQVFGELVKVGFKESDSTPGSYEPITIESPHKEEFINIDGKEYRIAYYFTSIQKADDIVANDELTPLVFYHNKLVGMGWDFLFDLKNSR